MAYGRPIAVRSGMGRTPRRRPSDAVPAPTPGVRSFTASAALQLARSLSAAMSVNVDPGTDSGTGVDSTTYRYIRAGATGGDGKSWTTAWGSFATAIASGTVTPGVTVWVAGGNYGTIRPAWNGTSSSRITIKAATNANHGTSNGWSSGYAVDTGYNPVIFDGGGGAGVTKALNLDGSNYVTVDGQVRTTLESGHGIVARNAFYPIHCDNGSGSNGITLRYIESSVLPISDIKLKEDGIQGKGNDLIVEYCFVHDNDSGDTHGDGIQWFGGNRLVLRYNVFKNNGQQIYLGDGGLNTYCNNVEIYYNVIYNRGGGHYNGILIAGNATAQGSFNGQNQPGWFHIYNNTFDLQAGSDNGFNTALNGVPDGPDIFFSNNAFRDSGASTLNWRTTNAANYFDNSGTGTCFSIPTDGIKAADLGFLVSVPASASDYRLLSSSVLRGKGTNVGLTQDILGNPVPATPDVGAFQFV